MSTIIHTLSDDEERLIRLLRIGDFLTASSLYGRMVQDRRAEDARLVEQLAGEHGRTVGKIDW